MEPKTLVASSIEFQIFRMACLRLHYLCIMIETTSNKQLLQAD